MSVLEIELFLDTASDKFSLIKKNDFLVIENFTFCLRKERNT